MLNRASFILIDSLDRDPLGTQGTLRVNPVLEFEEIWIFEPKVLKRVYFETTIQTLENPGRNLKSPLEN